jgi:hypothetical protein
MFLANLLAMRRSRPSLPLPENNLMNIRLRSLLLVAVLAGCGSNSTGIEPLTPPQVIQSCETNTATLCANWQRGANGKYEATWSQGSYAVIEATKFTADSVVFTRNDPSGTSAGMHAVYRGVPDDDSVVGIVTWTQNGQTFSGQWIASW